MKTVLTETPTAMKTDFAALHVALSAHNTPAAISNHLQAAFARRHSRRSSGWLHGIGQWFAPGSAIALSVSLSAWLLFSAPPAAMMLPASASADMFSTGGENPFIALRPLAQIELEPNPRLIETSVPKIMLAELGVTVSPEAAGDQVQAQLLVSAGGQPLALRFKPNRIY